MKNKFIKETTIIILFLSIISGCNSITQKQKQEKVDEKEYKNIIEPTIEPEENIKPIEIGLYKYENKTHTLISEYESSLPQYQDILSLEVYYTKDNTLIEDNQKNLWYTYLKKYEEIENNKIGFHINFKTIDKEIDKTILSPSDVESFFDYIQIYLYDDIHQTSSWYSHITQEQVTEDTIYTSIKLTGSTKIAEITSPISLTVFSYPNNDKDNLQKHQEKNSYKILIKRK